MNKLASVEEVLAVKPILGADRIELVQVLGYQSIVRKGEYKAGDKVIFVFPDTTIKRAPWNEFLFKEGETSTRIKTVRMRGEVSQGLVFPVSILGFDPVVGQDVAENIGVEKWEMEMPAQLRGTMEGYRPWYVPKTDESNIQSYPGVILEMTGKECVATLKMDGSSASFFWKDGNFGVTSRNIHLKKDESNSFWQAAIKYSLEEKLNSLARNIVIQSELCGPGIRENKLKLKEFQVFAFDVYDIDRGNYLPYDEALSLLKELGVPTVPEICIWEDFTLSLEDLVALANQQKYPEDPAEGIVVRCTDGRISQFLKGSRLSVKVMNQIFEEKYCKSRK